MKKIAVLIFFLTAYNAATAQTPTWADNIACILYTRCTSCHHTGGIAPFPLMDYNDAYNNRNNIMMNVINGIMPPWPPDKNYQEYAHERVLSQQEVDLITDWVNNNAPMGNISNAPAPPVYNGIAQIANPDLSVIMPAYTVPVITSDLYRCFVIPNVNTADEFITALEVLPGNSQVVHHVLVFSDTSQTCINLDLADPGPGYTNFGGVGSTTAMLLGAWVPGSQVYYPPQNMGMFLNANSHIILQVHYPLGSSGQVDSTRVNMEITNNPATRSIYIYPILNHYATMTNGPLFIPADSVKTFHEQYTMPVDATFLTVAPHMHLIGTSIISYGVSPAGDTIKFINIPEWDFHWQGGYSFRQPFKIPASTILHATAVYDNTVNNPHNPNNPPADIYEGEATTDEMMLVYFYFTAYQAGDQNIVIDTSTAVQTYNNCSFALNVNTGNVPSNGLYIYPNPAKNNIKIYLPFNEPCVISIYTSEGKKLHSFKNNPSSAVIDAQLHIPGVYLIKVLYDEHTFTQKFVITE